MVKSETGFFLVKLNVLKIHSLFIKRGREKLEVGEGVNNRLFSLPGGIVLKKNLKSEFLNIRTKDTIVNNWMVGISKILALNVFF